MTRNLDAESQITAFQCLEPNLESARFVLHDRPEAMARWLAIWAEENTPQFLETIYSGHLEKALHSGDDGYPNDIPRSEVFI